MRSVRGGAASNSSRVLPSSHNTAAVFPSSSFLTSEPEAEMCSACFHGADSHCAHHRSVVPSTGCTVTFRILYSDRICSRISGCCAKQTGVSNNPSANSNRLTVLHSPSSQRSGARSWPLPRHPARAPRRPLPRSADSPRERSRQTIRVLLHLPDSMPSPFSLRLSQISFALVVPARIPSLPPVRREQLSAPPWESSASAPCACTPWPVPAV